MKSYIFPVSLAAAGAALLIHYKSEQKKEIQLPSTPKSTVVAKKQFSREPEFQSVRDDGPRRSPPLSPTAFKKGAINPKNNSIFDKPYEFFHQRLQTLNQCLQTRTCPYPNRDPKEYEIALHAEAKTTLEALTTWLKRHHLRDERIADLMVDFLAFENASVKQEALKIMATQAIDDGVLEPVLEYVIEYPQPEAIPDGMQELRRYRSSEDKQKIDDTLERVLRTGAVNSAEEIAKNLKPFINKRNWQRYDKIRDDLARSPLSEDIYVALSEALDN